MEPPTWEARVSQLEAQLAQLVERIAYVEIRMADLAQQVAYLEGWVGHRLDRQHLRSEQDPR
jgi:hypothetical protein